LEFLKIFPEAQKINNKQLQQNVEKVWVDAIKLGGWKPEELFRIPFTLLIPDTDISIVEHTRAVTNLALEIADTLQRFFQKLEINRDYLLAGGILHDVGKLLEYEHSEEGFQKSKLGKLLRHPVSGVALAGRYEIPFEVIHIIYTHSKEGDIYERSIESTIIHYSDFINFESAKALKNE